MQYRYIYFFFFLLGFVLCQNVLPTLFVMIGLSNEVLFLTLSMVPLFAVPITMLILANEEVMVRNGAVSLLVVNISFYIVSATGASGPLAGVAYIMLVLSNVALLVFGLFLTRRLLRARRTGIFMVLLFAMIFLRYTPIVGIIYAVLDDYNSMRQAGWNLPFVYNLLYTSLYYLTFLFHLLVLDGIVDEAYHMGYKQ